MACLLYNVWEPYSTAGDMEVGRESDITWRELRSIFSVPFFRLLFITSNLTQKLMNKVTQNRQAKEKSRGKQIQKGRFLLGISPASEY
jgi:hypothetical protein